MKKLLPILFFVSSFFSYSQSNENKNVISAEIFGHSETIFSLNYERIFTNKRSDNLLYSLRLGVGRNPGYDVKEERFNGITSIPIAFSIFYGKKHFVQLRTGYTALFSENFVDTSVNPNITYKKFQSDLSVSIGYRLMMNEGLTVQAYPIFIFRDNPTKKNGISFGLDVGYAW